MSLTRKEAIAILKSKIDGSVDTSYEWAETIRMAIEALSEPYWIPISEGLPHEQELVNVTVVDDHGDNEWRYTATAWRSYDMWISDNEVVMGTVIAWTPLPKPYERNRL